MQCLNAAPAIGRGDGHARRQHQDRGGSAHADRDGRGPAVRHPRGWPYGGRRRRGEDLRVAGLERRRSRTTSGEQATGGRRRGMRNRCRRRRWSSHRQGERSGTSEDQDQAQGLRAGRPGPLRRDHRLDGAEDGRAGAGADPAAHPEVHLHGSALAARGQEVPRAVRDADPQAADRDRELDAADDGIPEEAVPPGQRGRRDQGLMPPSRRRQGSKRNDRTDRQETGHDADLPGGRPQRARHGHPGRAVRRHPGQEPGA